MNQHGIAELKNNISGELVTPSDTAYNDLRNVFVQKGSPAMIVRCKSTQDVAAAIRFAHDNQLTLAVRSGGHGYSGLATNDGGLVIDLSFMNAVEVLDQSQGLVRIGAGARWGDAAETLDTYGLAISSGDTKSVGVGGLTLGGGIGWAVRKYGLTIDSLESAEIVTADGRSLCVSATENPDLFWAIRGGGGNFGVVTSFDFRAHPLRSVLGGMLSYKISELGSVLTGWAGYMQTAPDELSSTLVIFPGMGPEPVPMLMVLLCYTGEDEVAAEKAVRPLRELGTLLHQDIQRRPYFKMLEDAIAPPGLKSVSHNGFVKVIDKKVIDALVANYGRAGTPIVQIRSLGGAVARVSPDATAFAHRDYAAFVLVASLIPADTPGEQMELIRHAAWSPLKPFASGAYVNFLTNVGAASVAEVYPPATYARLSAIKAAYDPDNVFNQNGNIKPVL